VPTSAELTLATPPLIEEQLDKAKSLRGSTIPNGQKYEDWLKGKEGRAEDGKNGSPS
jgi:hypothetical protein